LVVRLGEQNTHDRQDETTSQVRQPIVLHAHATLLSTDEPDNGIEPVESAAFVDGSLGANRLNSTRIPCNQRDCTTVFSRESLRSCGFFRRA
jgi:hypothetical protein